MKGLILSGGFGTRLRPITHTSNKHLVPLANKPMLYYGIETLRDAGMTEIGVIVGHTPQRIQEIKDAVGDGSQLGVLVTYVEQDAPRGIAHAIKTAEPFLRSNNRDRKFVVHLGDNILRGGIKAYVDAFASSDDDAFTLFSHIPELEMKLNTWGSPVIENGKLVGIIEKPKVRTNDLAFVGIYGFNDSFFAAFDKLTLSPRNEYEIADAVTTLVKMGKKVQHYVVDAQWWRDPGNTEGVLEANALILDDLKAYNKGSVEDGATVIGKVGIGEGTVVKSGASIRGPVIIGKNCLIGSKANIGPHTSIGDNTTIENAEIEYCVIMGDAKIECDRRITNSLMGRNVRVTSARRKSSEEVQLVIGENSLVSI
jgi:glucose-1-phosphate thymidylyltransferase